MGERKEIEPILPLPPGYSVLRSFTDEERRIGVEESELFDEKIGLLFLRSEFLLEDSRYFRTLRYQEKGVLENASASFPQTETSLIMITYWWQPTPVRIPFRVEFRDRSRLYQLVDILGEIYYNQKGQFGQVSTMPLSLPISRVLSQVLNEMTSGEISRNEEQVKKRSRQLLEAHLDTYVMIGPEGNGKFRFTGIVPGRSQDRRVDLGLRGLGEEIAWDELKYSIFSPEEGDKFVVETRSFKGNLKKRLSFPKTIPAVKVKELLTQKANWWELPNLVPVKIETPSG